MAKRKIRNRITGEVREVDESELGNYGLQTQSSRSDQVVAENATLSDTSKTKAAKKAQEQKNKSVLQGNLKSSNLVGGSGLLSNILNAVAAPVVATGQTIGGGLFEAGRAGLAAAGRKDVYNNINSNPFLTPEKLIEYDKDPVGALKKQVFNSAATASFGIPIGGGATSLFGRAVAPGALKGGAAVGALSSLPNAQNPMDIFKGAALGGVGGKVLGDVLPAVAGKVRNITGSGVNKAADAFRKEATEKTLKASPSQFAKAVEEHGFNINDIFRKHFGKETNINKILGEVSERGSGGDLGQKIAKAEKIINAEISKAGSNIRIPIDEFSKALNAEIALLRKIPGNKEKIAAVQQIADDLTRSYKNGVTLKQALNMKRAGDNKFGKAVVEEQAGSAISSAQKVIANTARSVLKGRFKNIAGALDEETELYTLKPILNNARGKGSISGATALGDILTFVPFAAVNPALALPALGAKRAIESPRALHGISDVLGGAAKLGGKVPNVSSPMLKQALGMGGAQVASAIPRLGVPTIPQDNQPETDNQNYNGEDKLNQDSNIVSQTGTGSQAADIKAIQQALALAMLQDLSNGGKNVTELKTISDVIGGLAESEEKSLPVAAQNQVNLGQSGLRGLQEAKAIVEEDPNVLAKQLVPGKWASRQFDSAMFRTVEALLRARSGAAVPEQEVRRYMTKYAPIFGDSPEVIKFKFEQLDADLREMIEGAGKTGGAEDYLNNLLLAQ